MIFCRKIEQTKRHFVFTYFDKAEEIAAIFKNKASVTLPRLDVASLSSSSSVQLRQSDVLEYGRTSLRGVCHNIVNIAT